MKTKGELLELENILQKLSSLHSSFDYLRITIASPERIRNWAERILPTGEIVGEVLRAETINFRTHKPEEYGLFCQRIFGPIKDWKCRCGYYNGFILDKICEDCNVEVIEARVRRYRMGYIDLVCPVSHFWYLKSTPSYLTILLKALNEELTTTDIEYLIYLKEPGSGSERESRIRATFKRFRHGLAENNEISPLYEANPNPNPKAWLSKRKKRKRNLDPFSIRVGAEILKAALESMNLKGELVKAREFLINEKWLALNKNPKQKSLIRRIRIFESFLSTKTNPSWLIFTILPVLPPNLRPLVELENGLLVAADVNEIYRLILTRNERLWDFIYFYMAPDIILIQGRKLLQESVDSLIDNARISKEKKLMLNNKALKSLTEILEGKQGRFRQYLLGKRVDYSGRSVIVVGPNLRLNQCGLPYQMGIELFQPFIIHELLKTKIKAPSHNTKLAQIMIKKNKPFIWTLLAGLTKKHSILLNRAPTLHRFGIQAFDSIIVLGQSIHLHPLVCTGFNADFDGDQMAVHLPLYEASQLEIRTMMRPSYNVLSPANGEVILKPTQDMVIGCYYLTLMIACNKHILQKSFPTETSALQAYYQKKINVHTPILVRYSCINLTFFIENNTIDFCKENAENTFSEKNKRSTFGLLGVFPKKEIVIYKKFSHALFPEKVVLITNIGIFSAKLSMLSNSKQIYLLTDFFLETSPGRLLFSKNFILALKY